MDSAENITEFYQRNPYMQEAFKKDPKLGDFGVFTRDNCPLMSPYNRRTFYKVALVLNPGKLFYANRWIHIERPALQFSNPMVPYAWESTEPIQEGWFCLFTESFLQQGERSGSLANTPFFQTGGDPILFLDNEQQTVITILFKKMMEEMNGNYVNKFDVLRNYLHVLMHEAIKLKPASTFESHHNASTRITSLFLELLERQFPVHYIQAPLTYSSAKDYANQLSVHVNSLNRAVKAVTGKTTTQIINERMIDEASKMLQYTDWTITQIAIALGFEEANNFTPFFKKHTNKTPSLYRKTIV